VQIAGAHGGFLSLYNAPTPLEIYVPFPLHLRNILHNCAKLLCQCFLVMDWYEPSVASLGCYLNQMSVHPIPRDYSACRLHTVIVALDDDKGFA
jgi:hypothetical protein